ncbi:MAG: 6-carboxytetrahydropterin synthase [Phycisphaeraceae bacterium]|nr:MAG: 6-carboxytetrahydropterin synthase [Phycisphaeraceae bacterium]
MTASNPTTALIRQQFDFAAAHRLHVPELSAEENLAIFGHCNNPAGHGHNYRFEPCVAVSLNTGKPDFTLGKLEQLAHEVILSRFDHKHLNHDTEEFGPSGVIPSVENIAKVFFDLMAPAVRDASSGKAELHAMTVWETDRTSCTYPADNPTTNSQ